MTIQDWLDSLPPMERERAMGRLEGMTLAQRICRNRAADGWQLHHEAGTDNGRSLTATAANEAETLAAMIRFVQVGIGNGTLPFGPLTVDEQDALARIF